jgi:hypothetical protein
MSIDFYHNVFKIYSLNIFYFINGLFYTTLDETWMCGSESLNVDRFLPRYIKEEKLKK